MGSFFIEDRNCWRITQAEQIEFLIDGADYFQDLYKTLQDAEDCIYIVGWDIDSEVRLLRDDQPHSYPVELGAFLNQLVSKKPNLNIYLLIWDFHAFFALERELFPQFKLGYQTHKQIHFFLDDQHPVGASHHQKIVVVDDNIAYCGGLDITRDRWDTSEHQDNDSRRQNPRGRRYGPFHDVQMKVTGETALALGELARERWLQATGGKLSSPTDRSSHKEHDSTGYTVAIARTLPEFKDEPEHREIEQALLDLIASAEDSLYIENQYLTSHAAGQALAASLSKEQGPEIIIILPLHASGWLEEAVMDSLRAIWIHRLQKADQFNRLRLYCPISNETDSKPLMIHSKVLIVDQTYARIGSSNLTNRSMGLDTECDLIVDASDNPKAQKQIERFRWRLLSEYLQRPIDEIARRYQETKSLRQVIDRMQDADSRIKPFKQEKPPAYEKSEKQLELLDPERPLTGERVVDRFIFESPPDESRDHKLLKKISLGALFLAAIIAIPLLWKIAISQTNWDLETVKSILITAREYRFTPAYVLLLFSVGVTLFIPLNLMIMATALIFPAWYALAYILTGGILCAAIGYGLGHLLGKHTIQKYFPDTIKVFSKQVSHGGILPIMLARMIPIAPYTVINMISGAGRIKFSLFLTGTALGLLPGTVLLVFFQRSLIKLIFEPSLFSAIAFGSLAVAVITAVIFLKRRFSRLKSHDRND